MGNDLLVMAISVVSRQVSVYVRTHNMPRSIQVSDLEQEAMLRMLRHIHKYDSKKGSMATFLEKHTSGAIIDYLRRVDGYSRCGRTNRLVCCERKLQNGSNGGIKIANSRQDPEQEYVSKDSLLKLVERLTHLPYKWYKVIVMYYWEDMTMKEIGTILGCNESRVSQIHKLALGRIRDRSMLSV